MANLRGADGEAAKAALQEGRPEEIWSGSELALLQYARALTVACGDREGLAALFQTARAAGVGDGELLEINQVVAYCNYANRTLNGTRARPSAPAVLCPAPHDQGSRFRR